MHFLSLRLVTKILYLHRCRAPADLIYRRNGEISLSVDARGYGKESGCCFSVFQLKTL
jgi:hypothetical protein